jgi:flagellar P-ring protein precursor FlgI
MKRKTIIIIFLVIFSLVIFCLEVKMKNLGSFAGVRNNQLIGYGVVVGLEGTGDTTQNKFTFQTIANYLDKMGVTVDPKSFQMRNTAAVAITATLPPFPRVGQEIDVTVSSIGSAKSIQGGILMVVPLRAADGKVYAVAQGAVSIGGFNASQGGGGIRKNHSTVGRIPNGAIIENEINFTFTKLQSLTFLLNKDDFTTASRVVKAINSRFNNVSRAMDSKTIKILIPDLFKTNKIEFVAMLENITVSPDVRARIVINERTGTIVFGEDVRISKVALAHGNITISIRQTLDVSQPNPMAQGDTVITQQTEQNVSEDEARFTFIGQSPTIGDIVKALNSLGATPRDIIAILQAIKEAGALHGTLTII